MAWYVVSTRPGAERQAKKCVSALIENVDCFLPLVPASPDRGRIRPLLPDYLFLKFDSGFYPTSLRQLRRLMRPLTFDGVAAAVSDKEIDDLRRKAEEISRGGGWWPCFKAGDQVMACLGKVEKVGEVVSVVRDRVRVLMKFFGRLIQVEVSRGSIRPANGEILNRTERGFRRTRGKGRYIKGVISYNGRTPL